MFLKKRRQLSEEARREIILYDDLWKVIFQIALPLVLFNAINMIFKIFDAYMAASFGAIEVSAVVFVHQIKLFFDAIGNGLALGGCILVARYFGARQDKRAARMAGNLYALAIILAFCLLVLNFFSSSILKLAHSPTELLPVARTFLSVQLITSAFLVLNTVYIGLEKAKGQSSRIMRLNIIVMVVKLGLSLFFIYVLKLSVLMLAVATLIAQATLFLFALYHLTRKTNPFRLTRKRLHLEQKNLKAIIGISLPIMAERVAFSFGKVWVSALSGLYGGTVVGALGISNQISGVIIMVANGFRDGQLTVISQNLGNNNHKRALGAFYRACIINLGVGVLGFLLLTIFIDPIISLFAPADPEFARTIHSVLYYERIAFIALTIAGSIFALFYGFGLPRVVLVLSLLRLFAFRIPPLILLQKLTDWGSKSVGVSMMVSNLLVGLAALVFLLIYRKHFWPAGDRQHRMRELHEP